MLNDRENYDGKKSMGCRDPDCSAGTVSTYSPQGMCEFWSYGGHEKQTFTVVHGSLHGELGRNVALCVLCSQEVRHKTMNE